MKLGKVKGYSKIDTFPIETYLEHARSDPSYYALAAERMVKAIGEPEVVDTSLDPRESRIFQNKTILRYPAFKDFYGMEDTI